MIHSKPHEIVLTVLTLVVVLAISITPIVAAQETEPQESPKWLVTLGAWIPMLLLIGGWFYFMRKSGLKTLNVHRERTEKHMDLVEQKLDAIIEALRSNRE